MGPAAPTSLLQTATGMPRRPASHVIVEEYALQQSPGRAKKTLDLLPCFGGGARGAEEGRA